MKRGTCDEGVNRVNFDEEKCVGDPAFWWSVSFDAPDAPGEEERLLTLADLSGSIGSELISSDGRLVLSAAYRSSIAESDLRSRLARLLEGFEGVVLRSFEKVADQPWHRQHLDAFPPLDAGTRFTVMAPWHRGSFETGARIPLYIYPASAFGTGYHESTQIALTLLEDAVKEGDVVVDVGTGTGVLFIAALKLGAARAVARDLDPVTLPEVRRNMELNDLPPELCDLAVGDLLTGVEESCDLLTANILLEPNMTLLPDVRRVLKRDGRAVFSGMTGAESGRFRSALPEAGLSVERELSLGDWWGCRVVLAGPVRP